MPLRTVTGTCLKADGTAWAGGTVKFELLEPFETASEVYPRDVTTETLDAQGAFSTSLGVPTTGTAAYLITTPDGRYYTVYLASGAATDLMTILTLASSSVAQDAVQTVIDAANKARISNLTQAGNITDEYDVFRCNGTFTVTLPAATGSGVAYCIKNIGTGVITVTRVGTDLIDGAATFILSQYDGVAFMDAASGVWDVVG